MHKHRTASARRPTQRRTQRIVYSAMMYPRIQTKTFRIAFSFRICPQVARTLQNRAYYAGYTNGITSHASGRVSTQSNTYSRSHIDAAMQVYGDVWVEIIYWQTWAVCWWRRACSIWCSCVLGILDYSLIYGTHSQRRKHGRWIGIECEARKSRDNRVSKEIVSYIFIYNETMANILTLCYQQINCHK